MSGHPTYVTHVLWIQQVPCRLVHAGRRHRRGRLHNLRRFLSFHRRHCNGHVSCKAWSKPSTATETVESAQPTEKLENYILHFIRICLMSSDRNTSSHDCICFLREGAASDPTSARHPTYSHMVALKTEGSCKLPDIRPLPDIHIHTL